MCARKISAVNVIVSITLLTFMLLKKLCFRSNQQKRQRNTGLVRGNRDSEEIRQKDLVLQQRLHGISSRDKRKNARCKLRAET